MKMYNHTYKHENALKGKIIINMAKVAKNQETKRFLSDSEGNLNS